MNRTLYITKDGTLRRRENTLVIRMPDGTSAFAPIEAIDDINLMSDAKITTGLLDLLNSKGIALHVFNAYGRHIGDWLPDQSRDGRELIAQAAFWLDETLRHNLAVSFVIGAIENMRQVARYYQLNGSGFDVSDILRALSDFKDSAWRTRDVPELLGIEGSARSSYYRLFDCVIQESVFKMGKRVRRPPNNPMNALISYLNCLCYSMTLSQIRQTRLDPRISFLHSPSSRRTSLELDLSEIFKPLLVDRLIFTLVNKRMLKAEDFLMAEDGAVVLTKEARRTAAQAWDSRMDKTISNPETGRRVSWRRVVLLEAQKLQRHILDGAGYEPFRYRW